ncbi:MAG: hypothetical protein U0L85_06575, partial [Bacilli bacterium]|nr:hypothetical protein [Bacilli bacterium]
CIITSKLTVCIVYEYMFCAMILIPLYIAFALCGYTDILFWMINIIDFVTLPIYPLIICSVFIIVIMRFVPMVRRKDLFNFVGSLILIIVCLAFSMYMTNIEEMDANQLTALLLNGKNSMLGMFNYLFPHITFISQVLFTGKTFHIVSYFVVQFTAIIVFLLISRALYLKGALSIEETNSKRVKLTDKELTTKSKKQNILISYTIKELKILIRTPAYVMNCVISELMIPIMFVIGMMTGGKDLLPILQHYIPMIDHLIAYLLLIGIGLGFMASNTSMVSATSISREGAGYVFMKYIPVSLNTIFNAKVLSGFIVSQIMILFVYIGCLFILPISPLYILLSFISAEIGSLLGSYFGLMVDVIHPNLYWEDETSAVKRSISGMMSMFTGFGIMTFVVIICLFVPGNIIDVVAILIVLLFALLSYVLYHKIDIVLRDIFNKL